MGLVAVQHALSVSGIECPPLFFHLDAGQIGVAIFFGISGFLACTVSDAKPISWLRKRLSRIFVPYWIAVTGVLVANHFAAYKSVSLALIVAEYLGVAGWTHRGDLVGVHFWFISLLLFCYILAAIMRRVPACFMIIVVATVGWIWLDPFNAGHTLAFLTGFGFGKMNKGPSLYVISLAGVATAFLSVCCSTAFASATVAAISLSTLSIPIAFSDQKTLKIRHVSNMSYHFYLVHGPCYLAVAKFGSSELLIVLLLGTFISVIATTGLQIMETSFRSCSSFLFRYVQSRVHGDHTQGRELPLD